MTTPTRPPRDDGPEISTTTSTPGVAEISTVTSMPRVAEIDHDPRCRRRKPPVLIAGWNRNPLLNCPDCGRTAPAADQRPANPERTP